MYRVDTSLVSVSEFISRKPVVVVVFIIQTGVSLSKELTSKPYCKYKSWAGKKMEIIGIKLVFLPLKHLMI